MQFLLVCLGGAVGSGARYLLSEWIAKAAGAAFPFGTLAVNLLGSFLVALLMVIGTETTLLSPTMRIALTTGVMGGFTTYSAFSHETMKLLQEARWLAAIGNVVVTLVGCLAACFLGWLCGKRWFVS